MGPIPDTRLIPTALAWLAKEGEPLGRQDRSGATPPRLPVPEQLSASRQWPSQGGERLLSPREGFQGFLVWPEEKSPPGVTLDTSCMDPPVTMLGMEPH